MSILYINRDKICLCNNNVSKIYYVSDKTGIDYNKLNNYITTIGKRDKLIVVVSSFYTTIDFIQKKNDKINFLNFLYSKFDNKEVICGNVSLLNKENSEAVVTTIRSNPQESHIAKIMELLYRYNIDLRYIYCLEQIPLLYGLGSNVDVHGETYVPELNIVVILFENKFFLSVAIGVNFILGREIVINSQGELINNLANTLSMAIKNIETTYINIHMKAQIKIFSFQENIDVETLKSKDPILQDINISCNQLQIGKINKDALPDGLIYELLLIKLVLPRLKYLQPLISNRTKKHIQIFRIIRYIKIIFLFFCIAIGCLFTYYLISVSVLEIERKAKKINISKEKQKLKKYQDDNEKLSKDIVDIAVMKIQQLKLEDGYEQPLKILTKVMNDKKELLDVQSYKFDCLNSTKKDKIFFISFDIEMFNRSESYSYTQTTISQLITDISTELKTQYKQVSVFDEKLPILGIKELAIKDFFDTIFIVCTNDVAYHLPRDKSQFNDFLSKGKASS